MYQAFLKKGTLFKGGYYLRKYGTYSKPQVFKNVMPLILIVPFDKIGNAIL